MRCGRLARCCRAGKRREVQSKALAFGSPVRVCVCWVESGLSRWVERWDPGPSPQCRAGPRITLLRKAGTRTRPRRSIDGATKTRGAAGRAAARRLRPPPVDQQRSGMSDLFSNPCRAGLAPLTCIERLRAPTDPGSPSIDTWDRKGVAARATSGLTWGRECPSPSRRPLCMSNPVGRRRRVITYSPLRCDESFIGR